LTAWSIATTATARHHAAKSGRSEPGVCRGRLGDGRQLFTVVRRRVDDPGDEPGKGPELGLKPKAFFRGFTVAGCAPDEMGIGPVFSVPKLLKAKGLRIADIDLWELNEAFASQCLYARDRLEIDNDKYNVNGGSISIGHPSA
jgi:acetyl-CoA acetyltransferase